MYIYKVGVVGAGQMGAGIAQVVSYAGIPVVLKDVNQKALDRGIATVREVYEGRVKKGKMSAEGLDQKMSLVTPTLSFDPFADVDLVIEAIFEDLEQKKRLFAELHRICSPGAVFATNTSSLPISAMAAASGRPERVVGLHFFYPAPVMKLIEIIPALQTAPEVVDAAVSFAETLRKIPVRVKECPGFLVNRLLMPYINEACRALEEGASAQQIDEAMVKFGMPMGPLFLLDQVGIDISYHVAQTLRRSFGPRAEIPRILEQMARDGRLGRKSGIGFYVYDGRPDDLASYVQSLGVNRKGRFTPERLLYAMLNEACQCLEEGVASASDMDVALMAGIGFPQGTGGLLHWADTVGLDQIESRLRSEYAPEFGSGFWPSVYLQRLVSAGFTGTKARRGFFEHA